MVSSFFHFLAFDFCRFCVVIPASTASNNNNNNDNKKDFISRGHSFDKSIFHEGLK